MTTPAPGFRQKTLLLAQRLEEILKERESIPPEEACRLLLQADRIPPSLAGTFLRELVAGDRRFVLGSDGRVALVRSTGPPNRRLREARYTVLDLETTGGSPSADRILEVGAVRVEGGRLGDSFASLVNPGVPLPSLIVSLTGIREEMVAGAPSFLAVAEDLSRFIGDSVVVAHNLPFDLGFLNQELGRACGFILANPCLCTVRLGRRLLPQLPDRRLDTLADYFGFSFAARHRALGDAEVTARLLLKLLDLLEEKGIVDLRGLERFLGPAEEARREPVSGPGRRGQPSPPSSSAGS